MAKRLMDCYASDIEKLTKEDLLESIMKSQGRVLACEIGVDILMCKMTGTDIHHLGDAGYAGMSLPENIHAYGVAIRGIRHTYHRMAASIRR